MDHVHRVRGPLARYETGLRAELTRAGYMSSTVTDVVRAMARLSVWMRRLGVASMGLTPEVLEEYLTFRRRVASTEGVARRGVGPMVRFLRGCGAIPLEAANDGTPVEMLLVEYRDFLVGERGLAAESVRCYLLQGRKFLADLAEPLDRSLEGLDAAAVVSFILGQVRQSTSVWSAKTLVTATRSLLRFLHVRGLISGPLAGAVPAVAGWRLGALPRGLDRGQVEAVLAGPDVLTPVGLRDHAVLIVLARLGLRGAEAAALGLADVDWGPGRSWCGARDRVLSGSRFPATSGKRWLPMSSAAGRYAAARHCSSPRGLLISPCHRPRSGRSWVGLARTPSCPGWVRIGCGTAWPLTYCGPGHR